MRSQRPTVASERPFCLCLLSCYEFFALFKNVKTHVELPSQYQAHPCQIRNWKAADKKEPATILDFYQMDSNGLKKSFDISEIVVTSGEKGGYILSESGGIVQYKAKKATLLKTPQAQVMFSLQHTLQQGFTESKLSRNPVAMHILSPQGMLRENTFQRIDQDFPIV